MVKKFSVVLSLVMVLMMCSGCFLVDKVKSETEIPEELPNPIVTIEMEDGRKMKLELYPRVALNTVSNFVVLAQSGFYDGLIFHRVISGFMIQGGDPLGTGMGGPGYSIKGEFSSNGVTNDLQHTRGVISMARSGDPNSAGSQFFIMHNAAPYLDGQYAAFGKIVADETEAASLATLDYIAAIPTSKDKPLVEQKIKSITVDTGGYEYNVVKIEDKK